MKNVIVASIAVASLTGLLALLDLAMGIPFERFSIFMDVAFLLTAAMIGYMGYDALRDAK